MAAPYVKRWGANGFNDLGVPGGTPADSQFLNAVEDALARLLGVAPGVDTVGVWAAAGGGGLVYQKITANQIDPAAAIAKTQLAALNIANADVAGAAGIAYSKLALAGSIQNSDVAAAAAIDATKLASNVVKSLYRKNTVKQVVNTVAETDLLNGEITIGANVMGASGILRLTANGDWKQNSGAATDIPRLKLKLGATTILDLNVIGGLVVAANGTRVGWRVVADIVNLGATNSQWAAIEAKWTFVAGGVNSANFFTTGAGITQTVEHATGVADMGMSVGGGASAVDTTAAQALALSVTLPAANAALDVTLRNAFVEVL